MTQSSLTTINMDAREVQRGEPGYPDRLAALSDAPPTLWIVGDWQPAERSVAIVGARAARPASLELARSIAARLAGVGADIISGGALGVDAAAHRGAMGTRPQDRGAEGAVSVTRPQDRGAEGAVSVTRPQDRGAGNTVAVLGNGIDVVYPEKHAELFVEIQKQGALVTQFPPGRQPRPGQFPTRNKVIAGLSELVVVIEASAQSGSLHTARAARALGRPVVAVPGSPGTDVLLTSGGALPAMNADDVLAIFEGRPLAPPELPDELRRLYDALDTVPRDVSDLAFRAGLGISTCASMVIDLELSGLCARAAGGRYVRLR